MYTHFTLEILIISFGLTTSGTWISFPKASFNKSFLYSFVIGGGATAATGTAATDATGLWPLNSSLGLATCAGTAGTQNGLKLTYQNIKKEIIEIEKKINKLKNNEYYNFYFSEDEEKNFPDKGFLVNKIYAKIPKSQAFKAILFGLKCL